MSDKFPDSRRYLTIESVENGYLVCAAFQVKQPTPSSTTTCHIPPTNDWEREILRFTFREASEVLAFVTEYMQPKGT